MGWRDLVPEWIAARARWSRLGPQGLALGKMLPMESENGAQGRNRTTDTAIFSRMLYQLSYLGVLREGPKEKVKTHRAGGL